MGLRATVYGKILEEERMLRNRLSQTRVDEAGSGRGVGRGMEDPLSVHFEHAAPITACPIHISDRLCANYLTYLIHPFSDWQDD